jgi:hypothetical protein
MLPYRERYERFRETDCAATQRVWWDRTDASGSDLEAQLGTAIDGADVLGIPDPEPPRGSSLRSTTA